MLFIAGIKHSGKTTLAKLIAKHLNVEFVDNDDLILSTFNISSIRSFYQKEGKERFMELEAEALEKYLNKNIPSIIALGGGACDNLKLINMCKQWGKVIYLSRPEDALLKCILKDGVPPFLDKNNIKESFHKLYKERDLKYRNLATYIIDLGPFKAKADTASEIIKFLEENNVW